MGDDGAGYRAKAKQSDGKGVSMGVTMDAVSNPSVDGLQRALEAEAVNHLPISEFAVDGRGRETEGYDVTVWKGIQRVMVRSWGSASAGIPPEVEDGGRRHGGYHALRSAARTFDLGKREVRFTPNGTRIPGTPPSSGTSNHVTYLNLRLKDLLYLLFLNPSCRMATWRSFWMGMKRSIHIPKC